MDAPAGDATPPASDAAVVRRWIRALADPHLTALRWHRTRGCAWHAGVIVHMQEPPAIVGDDIEYIPAVVARIDGRTMTAEEIDHVDRLLVQMAADARDALEGQSTLAVVVQLPERGPA